MDRLASRSGRTRRAAVRMGGDMPDVHDLSGVHRLAYDGAIDADGHILEPPDMWERYLDPEFRDRALRIVRDANGLEELEIGGRRSTVTTKGMPSLLGVMGAPDLMTIAQDPDRTYVTEAAYGSFDPAERLRLLDAEGLDAAVLYPTLGLLWEAELEDPVLSQAYTRAVQPLDLRVLRGFWRSVATGRAFVAVGSGGGGDASSNAPWGRAHAGASSCRSRTLGGRWPTPTTTGSSRRPRISTWCLRFTPVSSRIGRRASGSPVGTGPRIACNCSRRSEEVTASVTNSPRSSTWPCSISSPGSRSWSWSREGAGSVTSWIAWTRSMDTPRSAWACD